MKWLTKILDLVKRNNKDFLYLIIICLSSFFFFYKLGQSSLVSWDDAWYAEIARNIIKTRNPIELIWNGKSYLDHPPFGFILVALSFLILGISEFAASFPAAFLGLSTLVIVYLLGRKLFNREVGVLSAVALLSAPWFLLRARSTNLEITLTFLFLTSFYLALKTIEDKKFRIPLAMSLAFLFLTKTLIPFAILPVILFLIFTSKKEDKRNLILSLTISLLIFFTWFLQRYLIHGIQFVQRYVSIGAPGVGAKTTLKDNIHLVKDYVYFGIGKWFWPAFAALVGGLFLRQKRFFLSFIFIAVFLFPFIFSSKGQIWHYIPIIPFLLLNLMGFGYIFLEKLKFKRIFILLLLFGFTDVFAYRQIKKNYNEFINVNAYTSDEEILSSEAGKYSEPFFIDENFGPAAIYYSGKNVMQVPYPELSGLFEHENKFLLITFPWRLERSKIKPSEYEILKSDRDKILIKK